MDRLEKLIEQKRELAAELHAGGMNCAQSVLTAVCDAAGLDRDIAVRISTGFGGGMKHGEVCGAVSGAIMALGCHYGKADVTDRENRDMVYGKVTEFLKRFREKHDTTICRSLIGYDLTKPEEAAAAREANVFSEVCRPFMKDAVEIALRILNE